MRRAVSITLTAFRDIPARRAPIGSLSAACGRLAVVLLWLWLLDACSAGEPFRAGPLYDEFRLTLEPGHRTEAAGPLFYLEEREMERTWAVPPVLSYARNPELELREFDIAYPILTYDRYGDQYRWQLFQLLSFAGGPTQTETNRDRFTLFPVFFWQRSSDTNEDYTAYGPFYGNLKHRLMRDEIFYVMFPFYSRTRKKDVVTWNYVYPIYHQRRGEGLNGWQLWPVFGNEHKEVTTRTNSFGELELVPGHDKQFALWPVYFNQNTGIGTTNQAWQQGVLPVYSLLRSPARDSTTVVWPFFSRIDNREKGYREWDAPWPLIVFARGPGKHTTRVFPFYSHAYNTNVQSDFLFWPIYKYNRLHSGALDRRRTRIAFWLYSDIVEKNLETSAYRRRTEMWPFFTHRRDLHGNTRLQVLALLEPLVPGSHKLERDYSPVWSLWRAEHNAQTGAAGQSLLWNLYRRDVQSGSRKLSLFFGLYQSSQDAQGTRRKLFFIPISK